MLVPNGTLVVMFDGMRVRLLRNRGRAPETAFETVPGDAIRRCGTRVAADGERGLIQEVIAAIAPMLAGGTPLILVAPGDLLEGLRAELPRRAHRHIVAEVRNGLADYAPRELARRLCLA